MNELLPHPATLLRPGRRSMPRHRPQAGQLRVVGASTAGGYGGDLLGKTRDYARQCLRVAEDERFDVVHAHDWMTFPAAEAVARRFNKPLVVHVHATEFDRCGEHVNQSVYDLERAGVAAADRVIAVSALTRRTLIRHYGASPQRTFVVHNGIRGAESDEPLPPLRPHRRTVLFMGRVTRQKGPGYFLDAAERVLGRMEDARFIVAGSGDMLPGMVRRIAHGRHGNRIRFTGFLQGSQIAQAYRAADVYVMPSVSEPFGLTALEAARYGTPAIISTSSGAAEVLRRGALTVEHWDVDRMAMQIMAVLQYPALAEELRQRARRELRALTWDAAAHKCLDIYAELTGDGLVADDWTEPDAALPVAASLS